MKKSVIILTAAFFLTGCTKQQDQPQRTFLIPEGYTGWVTVHNDPSAVEKKEYKVNKAGETSVNEKNIHDGWAATTYFYVDEKGERKELSRGKMIHGASSGDQTGKDGEAYFFVGDKQKFETTEYVPEDQ
ncbi:DUF6843 domain-containing protein [Metabacillus idriensis]|uniref:DUF6843 domain-containing protein n=1 Tax=Metabacillus idriensis TaxID=324768 RepID=UPI003D2A53D4